MNPDEVRSTIGEIEELKAVDKSPERGAKNATTKTGKCGRHTCNVVGVTTAFVRKGAIVTDITGVGDNPVLGPTLVSS